MVKHALLPALSLASLFLIARPSTSAEAASKAQKSKLSTIATASKPKSPVATPSPSAQPAAKSDKPTAKTAAKPSLGDGLIAQNTLRIYLTRPATVTVHNARGQLLFHVESQRPTESLPLSGIHAGFLYLTFRSGPLETTRKLIYSGK